MAEQPPSSWWKDTIQVPQEINTRTYRCKKCGEVLFRMPTTILVPEKKKIVRCSKGHRVMVPDFAECYKEAL